MRSIILNTAAAIARDKDRPGEFIYTEAGTVLAVPSEGLTADTAKKWVEQGAASAYDAKAAAAEAAAAASEETPAK